MAEAEGPIAALDRVVAQCDASGLPLLIGTLERLKAQALSRLIASTTRAPRMVADPVDDLRHLTPLQVAELLNLKEAYVHELCRSSQMPSVKQGKYWMIPLAELREWLGRPRRGVDPRRAESIDSTIEWPAVPAPSRTGAKSGTATGRPNAPDRRQPRRIASMNTKTREAVRGSNLVASPESTPARPVADS